MKKVSLLLLVIVLMSFTGWQTDFDAARKQAREKHQLILLNFSGSDWCGPCIRLRKELFDSGPFSKMADTTLVLVNADFPRNKKNQLDKSLIKQNEALADQYNREGRFPFTVLLDASGKLIKSWDGLPKMSATEFAMEVKTICDANKQ